MLELKNITYCYPEKVQPVIDDLSLTLPECGLFLLDGVSGSGKTTLLNIINGTLIPQEGIIYYGSDSSDTLTNEEISLNIAYIYQDFHLLNQLTVKQNLGLVCEDEQKIEQILSLVQMSHLKDEKVLRLSTGEQQRVAIARSFLEEKKILLCDEATANLDIENRKIILSSLKEISKNTLVIAVSHQKDIYTSLVDGWIRLENGKVSYEIPKKNDNPSFKVPPKRKKINFSYFLSPYRSIFIKNFIFCLFILCISLALNLFSFCHYIEDVPYGTSNDSPLMLCSDKSPNELENIFPERKYADYSFYYPTTSHGCSFYNIFETPVKGLSEFNLRINPIPNPNLIKGKNRSNVSEVTIGLHSSAKEKVHFFELLNSYLTSKITNERFIITGYYMLTDESERRSLELNIDYGHTEFRYFTPFLSNPYQSGIMNWRENITYSLDASLDTDILSYRKLSDLYFSFNGHFTPITNAEIRYVEDDNDRSSVIVNPIRLSKKLEELPLGSVIFYDNNDSLKRDLSSYDCFYPFAANREAIITHTDELYFISGQCAVLLLTFVMISLCRLTEKAFRSELKKLSALHFNDKKIWFLQQKFLYYPFFTSALFICCSSPLLNLIFHRTPFIVAMSCLLSVLSVFLYLILFSLWIRRKKYDRFL